MKLALASQTIFFNPFNALFEYHKQRQEQNQGVELCKLVSADQGKYTEEQKTGDIGTHFYLAFEWLATTNLLLKEYEKAEIAYQQALKFIDEQNILLGKPKATVYHQLGAVAQEQRQWETAVRHYEQVLAIFIEFDDKHGQTRLFHGFGRVAEEQKRWAEASDYFINALKIFHDFQDTHTSKITIGSLLRVYQAIQSATFPEKVALSDQVNGRLAAILGISREQAKQLITDNG